MADVYLSMGLTQDLRLSSRMLVKDRWFTLVAMLALGLGIGINTTVFTIVNVSAVGIYAVTAYSVTQRTQEIGVRMALGAQAGQVAWMILRQGLVQLAIGLTIGLAAGVAVGAVLQGLLVQVPAHDPVTVGTMVTVLILVTIAACLIPARCAARTDPLAALRSE